VLPPQAVSGLESLAGAGDSCLIPIFQPYQIPFFPAFRCTSAVRPPLSWEFPTIFFVIFFSPFSGVSPSVTLFAEPDIQVGEGGFFRKTLVKQGPVLSPFPFLLFVPQDCSTRTIPYVAVVIKALNLRFPSSG